jgi:hypothetical protein
MIKTFFENEMSEIYLWHMQFIMSVFQSHIQEIEKENNFVVEVSRLLISIHDILAQRQAPNFMSRKVRSLIEEKHKESLHADCDIFCAEVNCLYESCIEYLKKWMRPMEEFSCFMWMALNDIPQWSSVELPLKFLINKSVSIDDVKCFDHCINLKKFLEGCKDNKEFCNLLAHQKWVKYFKNSKNIDCQPELLKIIQFFAVPSHNANVGRIFSLIQVQWTKERSNLDIESVRGILLVQCNYKHLSCKEFCGYLKNNQQLLTKMRSTEKYARA